MKDKGILLDMGTGDLQINVVRDRAGLVTQGLQVGDVTKQNIGMILTFQPGELKSSPMVGVGIDNMLLGHDTLLYRHKIREQLEADGLRVRRLEIEGENIKINANY